MERFEETLRFRSLRDPGEVRRVLERVFEALQEKGYDPVGQLVGYLLSGDPTYITSHKDARRLIRCLERDQILEELITAYLAPRGRKNGT